MTRYVLASLIVVALVASALPLSGQVDDDGATSTTPVDVREALDRVERELGEVEAHIEEATRSHATRVEERRQERRTYATQLVVAELQATTLHRSLAETHERAASVRAELSHSRRDVDALEAEARSAAERAIATLSEVPGRSAELAVLRESARTLDADADPAATLAAIATTVETLTMLSRDAAGVTVRSVPLHTAKGQRERAQLLSIGFAAFAYRTEAGDRVGVAVSSPTEARGYRWSEEIRPDLAEALRRAIDDRARSEPGFLSVPLDPSGQIQADAMPKEETWFGRLSAGGPVMIPLAIVAVLALILLIERCVVLLVLERGNPATIRAVTAACHAGDPQRAEQVCAQRSTMVGRVLGACLARRHRGQRAMEDGIQEQLMHELPRLERSLRGLTILGTVAPLLGLLGTVTGIIHVFGALRTFGDGDPSQMAGGISEALTTTATGLTIAVPILIAQSFLRGRADRLVADAERHAATLLLVVVDDAEDADDAGQDRESSGEGTA